ncbi:hypothetical protein WJX73_010478 [Symbiochloris irregularis]|uniref:Uncharacterized protein n=1 Tax=Symbiochloris irregularis TaxID=706552 RepID=A0AAW1Q297_9CHLO
MQWLSLLALLFVHQHVVTALQVYQRPLNQDCVSAPNSRSLPSGSQYFPEDFRVYGETFDESDHVTVEFAQGFSVEYFDTYKIVRNTIVNETYVLYQCGLQPPSTDSLPEGSKLFSVPLDSTAVVETVPLAFLKELGVDSRLQSVSSYAVGSCAQKLLTCPGRTAPSLDTANATMTTTDLDALVPYADAIITSSAYALDQVFAFSATMDPGVLRRAEWVKFLGVFFNMDASSSEIFSAINESYFQTVSDIKSREPAQPPLMAFVDYLDYEPDFAFEVQFAPYKLQYTEDAGAVGPDYAEVAAIPGVIPSPFATIPNGTLWFSWGEGGGFATQAEAVAAFQAFLQTVDIVIDETYAADPLSYNLTKFYQTYNITSNTSYPFLRTSQVFREDGLIGPAPSYGLDWFEGAIARPDLVLGDFAAAVAPSEYPGRRPTWIRNIALGQQPTIISDQNCNQVTSCSERPSPICPYISTCPNGNVVQQEAVNTTCVYVPCS